MRSGKAGMVCFFALCFTLSGLYPVRVAASLPRVLSINLCTDQMLMLLANAPQIVALSPLGREQAGSYFHEQALSYPQADITAESIVPKSPDVVLAGPYTSRYTLAMLDELGIRYELITIANSIDAMLQNLLRIGQIVQQESRAQALVDSLGVRRGAIEQRVADLDEALKSLAISRPTAAVYDPNGYTVGLSTLRGEAMILAGWHNVAADKGIEDYGVLNLEDLIQLTPDALIESPYSQGTYSRGQALTSHPALRQSGLNPVVISLPSNQTICAGPWSLDVVERLVDAREKLQGATVQ